MPGALLLQLDASGPRQVSWDDSDLVTSWQNFLATPDGYLRHLMTSEQLETDQSS